MNKSFENGYQIAWDATSLSEAMTCPRKYQYSIVEGWRSKETSVHLLFGGLYAAALEQFYKLRAAGVGIEDATLAVVKVAMINSWGENSPLEFADNAKTRFGLIRSIVWYLDTFADESESVIQTYHLANGLPAVELSFSFEVEKTIGNADSSLLLCGHLDRVVSMNDSRFIMDQKTTGSAISATYFRNYDLDNQMSLYTLAGQVVLQSPIAGVIIDAAEIKVGFTRFERGFTYRTQEQLEEWVKATATLIESTWHYTSQNFFPQNTKACGFFSGCQFREVCSASPRFRENILREKFQTRVWDPLERR